MTLDDAIGVRIRQLRTVTDDPLPPGELATRWGCVDAVVGNFERRWAAALRGETRGAALLVMRHAGARVSLTIPGRTLVLSISAPEQLQVEHRQPDSIDRHVEHVNLPVSRDEMNKTVAAVLTDWLLKDEDWLQWLEGATAAV